jgi:hypothetical protein
MWNNMLDNLIRYRKLNGHVVNHFSH